MDKPKIVEKALTPAPLPAKDGLPVAAPETRPAELGGGVKEYGGAKGPEPTRYGDWQHKGRCTDF